MREEIRAYYNKIAKDYDSSRFSNTYGASINQREHQVLSRYISKNNSKSTLDIACGTGRFLEYAEYGLDVSPEMVRISRNRFPNKNITVGDAEALPYEQDFFENAISFHLFMHLDYVQMEQILSEVNKVTKKGGYFIFDVPSEKRRKLTNYKSESWHGGHQINSQQLKSLLKANWEMVAYHGVLFFPLHRIPVKLRRFFTRLDHFLCDSVFKEYSSHLIFVLKKK